MVSNEQKLNFHKTPVASAITRLYLDADGNTDDNDTPTRDFVPAKNLVISNIGNTDLKLFKNNGKGYDTIPSGTIYEFNASSKDKDAFSNLTIINTSSTLAGEYEVIIDSSDTLKSLMYEMVQGFRK